MSMFLKRATMPKDSIAEKYYPDFINFLLMQKKAIVTIGSKYDLTPMQSLALLMLVDPMPMYKITESFSCDASNVTGIIDGLQNKGLAIRFENEKDRRIRMVKLKPKGKKLREDVQNQLLGNFNPVFINLNQEELATFFNLINKVVSAQSD
jgi:DNA-binding MarR family transcriptional regulator